MKKEEYDDDDKRVCHNCIGDVYLKAELKLLGSRKRCSYCKRIAKSYTLEQISDRTGVAFLEHYERTPDQMDEWQYRLHNDESGYNWSRDGEYVTDILMDVIGAESDIAEDIHRVLKHRYYDMEAAQIGEETEFHSESCYDLKGISTLIWHKEWEKFENILKTRSRYFNHDIYEYLKNIFSDIEEYTTYDRKGLITTIGPGCAIHELYRARAFQSEDRLLEAISYPDRLLGPPSSTNAKAGRMNANGIAVFYSATESSVALAEVRPPVGSYVAIAKFEVLRKLRLLDLTKLDDIEIHGSIFDSNYRNRVEKGVFLKQLKEILIRPVMPDNETFEYLPTQVVADFLATNAEKEYDGIIFPSAQVAAKAANIVLFNKAAKVEEIPIPEDTVIKPFTIVYDGEEEYTSYNVTEFRPLRRRKPKENQLHYESENRYHSNASKIIFEDERSVTLRVDLDGIHVMIVKGINFATDQHHVSRTISKARKSFDITDF